MRFLSILLSLALSASLCFPGELSDRTGPIANLSVGEKAWEVTDLEFKLGHMRVRLASGKLYPLKIESGFAFGGFFYGKGTFEYTCDDPHEKPVAKNNAGDLVKSETSGSVVMGSGFPSALMFFKAGLPPSVYKMPKVQAPLEGGAEETYEKMMKKYVQIYLNGGFEHHVAAAQLNLRNNTYAYIEMARPGDDVGYVFDAISAFKESLYLLKDEDDQRWARRISRLPIQHSRFKPVDPDFIVKKLDVQADLRDLSKSSFVTTLQVLPQRSNLKVLRFDLYNCFKPDKHWTHDKEILRVESVQDGEGKALEFSHKYDEILVAFPEALNPGAPVTLTFKYGGDFTKPIEGTTFTLLGVEPWYPRVDKYASRFIFHGTIKSRKPYHPVATGRIVRFETEKDEYLLETETPVPVERPVILAGKFKPYEEKHDGLNIRVYSYAFAKKKSQGQLASLAHAVIDYYSKFLGPYAFGDFQILEIPYDWGYGIAPPGMMFITQEAFSPRLRFQDIDPLTAIFSNRGVNERIVHEIAHQWWAHTIKYSLHEDRWLSESFAEYFAAVCLDASKDPKEYDRLVSEWKRMANDSWKKGSIAMADHLRGDRSGEHRTNLLYGKGPYVLHMLRAQLGDKAFFDGLCGFARDHRMRHMTTDDLFKYLSMTSGKDLTGFCEKWIRGINKVE
ncbi:M1 family metallopeptidase [Acidobacteriota bacterium]